MAATDANYKFIFVDVGSYGKCCGSTMFQQTTLYQRLESDTIDPPEDKPISNVNPVPRALCVSH